MRWMKYQDNNGIIIMPLCMVDINDKCFNSSNEKQCNHVINKIKLDEVGDYVVFPSRWYYRGHYQINSNTTYYTTQLFSKPSEKSDMWQNVTRKVNRNLIQGPVELLQMRQLTKDKHMNWDKDK